MKENTNRLGGTIINWITIFVQIVISLFFVPFFLKTVGDKQYGLYSFSTSIIAWIDTLMVSVAAAYYKFLTREKKRQGEYGEARACGIFAIIFIIITISILIFGFIFDFLLYSNVIPLTEYSVAEKNQICLIILLSLISTAITCSVTTFKCYHFYKQQYILIYSFALIQIIIQTVLSVIFLKMNLGVVSIACAHLGTGLFFTIILTILSKTKLKQKVSIKPKTEEDKKYRKELFRDILFFSLFVVINTVVDIFNRSLDKVILGFYNADSVATYQLAYTFPAYLISFTSIISIVYEQKMNEVYYNGGGLTEMNEVFIKISKIQTIICFLIIGGFVACGREFVSLWIGSGREQVYFISCILMITYSISCSSRLALSARRIQNLHKKASFIYLGIVAFNIALSLLLVNFFPREYAIWCCVTGTTVTYVLGYWIILQIYDSKKTKISIGHFFVFFLKYLFIAASIDLFVISFCKLLPINSTIGLFFVEGILFAILYLVCVFVADNQITKEFVFKIKKSLSFKK